MREVLFIDDDTRLIASFADAVRGAGFSTRHFRAPDPALEYLRGDAKPDLIVWDMMLPPGEAFREADTESGLSTGKHLFWKMRGLRPACHYLLFTARGDVSFVEFDSPDTKSHVRFKTELSVRGLVEFIRELFRE
jgi:DNA-binding NtrC family response regulator